MTPLFDHRSAHARLDHIEPPVLPDNPNLPPPVPPAPAPDVVPVRDPQLPEHPDPVKEPPSYQPPMSTWNKWRRAAQPGALTH